MKETKKEQKYSDEACAIILMHHTIRGFNKKISSALAGRYRGNIDYSVAFREIGQRFYNGGTYLSYLAQSYKDGVAMYTRLQPRTLFEYNEYLANIVEFLQMRRDASLDSAIYFSKNRTSITSPYYYSRYASQRTIPAADLLRGLKYMKMLIAERQGISPEDVIVYGANEVIEERLSLEAKRNMLKEAKKAQRQTAKATASQKKVAETLGGTTLITPATLDNLQTADVTAQTNDKQLKINFDKIERER